MREKSEVQRNLLIAYQSIGRETENLLNLRSKERNSQEIYLITHRLVMYARDALLLEWILGTRDYPQL